MDNASITFALSLNQAISLSLIASLAALKELTLKIKRTKAHFIYRVRAPWFTRVTIRINYC